MWVPASLDAEITGGGGWRWWGGRKAALSRAGAESEGHYGGDFCTSSRTM